MRTITIGGNNDVGDRRILVADPHPTMLKPVMVVIAVPLLHRDVFITAITVVIVVVTIVTVVDHGIGGINRIWLWVIMGLSTYDYVDVNFC